MFVSQKDADGVIQSFSMLRMSNFHAHLRSGSMLQTVAPHIMKHMRYVLVMPNSQPIRTIEQALSYLAEIERIAERHVAHREVEFIMTLYLTDVVTPKIIDQIARLPIRVAIKYYPPEQGATTGSGHGIPLDQCHNVLRAMEETGIRLLGHFESVNDRQGRELPHALREAYFIENVLPRIIERHPNLLHCVEHASTAAAVRYVRGDPSGRTVMTVTPQHSLFVGADLEELGPGLKCMPIVKTEDDRAAIVEFITSGDRRAIAGDDTAPHSRQKKEQEGASGCWLPHSPELYATVFDRAGALGDPFERFMSLNGPTWWRLPPPNNQDVVTFQRRTASIPKPIPILGVDDVVVPLGYGVEGQKLDFTIV